MVVVELGDMPTSNNIFPFRLTPVPAIVCVAILQLAYSYPEFDFFLY